MEAGGSIYIYAKLATSIKTNPLQAMRHCAAYEGHHQCFHGSSEPCVQHYAHGLSHICLSVALPVLATARPCPLAEAPCSCKSCAIGITMRRGAAHACAGHHAEAVQPAAPTQNREQGTGVSTTLRLSPLPLVRNIKHGACGYRRQQLRSASGCAALPPARGVQRTSGWHGMCMGGARARVHRLDVIDSYRGP